MRANPWTIAALLIALSMGIAIGQHWSGRAMAQAPAPAASSVLRYQISAYAGGSPGTRSAVHHGCYIVDTQTGQVWHTLAGGERQDVSGPLP